MKTINLKFREVLFKEGTPAKNLFVVERGEVLCLKFSKDRLIPVFLAKKGDVLGESALIENLDYTYSAIALDDSNLLEIPSDSFRKIFNEAPDWIIDLTSTMITRFQNTSNLIAENRIIHSSIISEDQFPSKVEIEFKKLLA